MHCNTTPRLKSEHCIRLPCVHSMRIKEILIRRLHDPKELESQLQLQIGLPLNPTPEAFRRGAGDPAAGENAQLLSSE